MSSKLVRWGATVLVAGAALVASATPAPAPHIAQLQITPAQVQAGEEVTVFGPRGYGRTNPVEIRAGSADGPVLGTFTPNEELYAMWGPGTVRIPENAAPGTYYLFATQTLAASENHIRGVPARGEVTILGAGGAPVLSGPPEVPLEQQPTVGILEEDPVGMGSVLLVALGVAGTGLFVAGLVVAFSSRRRDAAPAAARK